MIAAYASVKQFVQITVLILFELMSGLDTTLVFAFGSVAAPVL